MLFSVGVIDPKPERFLGHKDGRSRDILRDGDPHFSEVIQNGKNSLVYQENLTVVERLKSPG